MRKHRLRAAIVNLESLKYNNDFLITPQDLLDIFNALEEEIEELWEAMEVPLIMQVEKKYAT